ncbi:MAG: NADH:flavin oxidoreductase/NADH oxidase [Chromatiaceae bacterium]|nr:NADH:flavin oxidoreductase/NADH oxidase [Chromatiaceae bacterium]
MTQQPPHLFRPLKLRGVTLPNRIVVSPMCQYSAVNGCAQDWHLMHLGSLAVGGNGMLIVEMTNVVAEGRITPHCLGLYDDACEAALKRVIDFCRLHTASALAVQLAHAGRKASTRPPWEGREPLRPGAGGWPTVGPSAIPASADDLVPRALSTAEIEGLVRDFAAAAQRAQRIGFDAIELHAAHGYLLHQFLSPLSNRRDDAYGGSLENRMRFPLAVFDAVRAVWPDDRPLGVRLSATDWIDGGWDMAQSLAFARALEARGCDWLDVSSGGLSPLQQVPDSPGYQVPFGAEIKANTSLTIVTVGMITEALQAESILAEGKADLVALARGMLYDPRWAWHAAADLGAEVRYPNQYLRCRPRQRADGSPITAPANPERQP